MTVGREIISPEKRQNGALADLDSTYWRLRRRSAPRPPTLGERTTTPIRQDAHP
jgi:hypothetical protein